VAYDHIRRAPIHIIDQGGITLPTLRARARQLLQQHGIKLLVVDYLQLIRSDKRTSTRYESITDTSNGLKQLAKELGIPLLCAAQLNRDSEKDNRRPRLSDLRTVAPLNRMPMRFCSFTLIRTRAERGSCRRVYPGQASGRTSRARRRDIRQGGYTVLRITG